MCKNIKKKKEGKEIEIRSRLENTLHICKGKMSFGPEKREIAKCILVYMSYKKKKKRKKEK